MLILVINSGSSSLKYQVREVPSETNAVLADGSIGIEAFVTRAQELAASYGDRFLPPASLLERARAGASIE